MKDASFSEVVLRTASELGISTKEVRVIVSEFLNQAGLFLIKNRTMHLMGLGRLQAWVRLGPQGSKKIQRRGSVVVSFTKASRVEKLAKICLTEEIMEKYGVDTSVDTDKLEKAASEGCPECGEKVERSGSVVRCRRCGTAPFEEKRDQKASR